MSLRGRRERASAAMSCPAQIRARSDAEMNDSWAAFVEVLTQEADAFAVVNERALRLSAALVENSPENIHAAQRALEEARKQLVGLRSRRRGMQLRGFGNLPLKKVARYAPPAAGSRIVAQMRRLRQCTIQLELVNSNNRALILGAMERLMAIVAVMRRAQMQPLTYKRRGIVPPPDHSMIVSHKA
jgi:hypothetical protein